MDALRISETSVYFKETTRCYIPEGCHLYADRYLWSSWNVIVHVRFAIDFLEDLSPFLYLAYNFLHRNFCYSAVLTSERQYDTFK
jgi:hypothetical protein